MPTPPDGHHPVEGISGSELRRDVSVWGSYMWGYAAVGADIYTALGIITLAALGLAPLAFLAAGIVFALVGLCYAELASAYPLAGGGQYFTLRGLGDLAGLVAGAALVLDYTIDISLFTVVAFGYFNYFLPWITLGHHITDFTVTLGPIHLAWLWLVESVAGMVLLIWLNVRGIKVSTNFNEIIGTVAIVAQSIIVLAGFVLVWRPDIVAHEFLFDRPTLSQFAFGSSLAIIAFVGLETISQVAQETRRPATIIPRTSIGLVISVLLFAMAFSVLAIGLVKPTDFAGHEGDPVALIAGHIPIIGVVAAPVTALIGFLIVFISANPGVVSSPRRSYWLGQFDLLPHWFAHVDKRVDPPVRAVIVFGVVALLQTVFAFFTPGSPGKPAAIDVLAHLYARIVGPLWVLAAIALFFLYRRKQGLPMFKTLPRDWETATKKVLLEAEEFKSLEEYEAALNEHRARTGEPGTNLPGMPR